jgi:hypothetical protein
VEVEALAAPDTLSRLMEPVVVLQVTPTGVEVAVEPGGETMSVRIHLGSDLASAERVVRKLAGAVTVISARVVREPGVATALAS